MKKISLFFTLLAVFMFFANCQQNTTNNTQEQQNQQQATPQTTQQQQEEAANKIVEHEFNEQETSGLDYKGAIVTGKHWEDKSGEHLLILTRTEVEELENDAAIQEIFGYHFLKEKDTYQQLWRVYDFTKDQLWMDITAKHLPKSLALTDVDENGIAETLFMYYLFAGTDVSPGTVKLMMHEGKQKYALRGSNRIAGEGGDYKIDKAFNDAPDGFLKTAKQHWENHVEVY